MFTGLQEQICSLQQPQSQFEDLNTVSPDAKHRKDNHVPDMCMESSLQNEDDLVSLACRGSQTIS
eukprot:11591986-Ditylum_brightwellii.AAC.1